MYPTMFTDEQITRFWHNVSPALSGCWEWLGAKDKDGYGRMKVGGRNFSPQRFAWEITFGTPTGFILQKCRNKLCVNPFHLRQAERKRKRVQKLFQSQADL